MARDIDKNALIQHKTIALQAFENYMDSLIFSSNSHLQRKADKLSYWLEDWAKFLAFESEFSPTSLRRYNRGEIIKLHLGFNIGSEEGGLHYAVVLDKNNSLHSPVVTVAPLTSVKSYTDVNKLHRGSVFLGNELFTSFSAKITSLQHLTDVERKKLSAIAGDYKHILSVPDSKIDEITSRLDFLEQKCDLLTKAKKEFSKMKTGSIALVGQIRTISKIRIYDPKTNFDILSNMKLSSEKLDLIDREIIKLYTRQ